MSCSFCAESIETAYARTEGVEGVDVSLAHKEVFVRYDDARLSEVEIKDTLRDLGYTIRDPDKENGTRNSRRNSRTASVQMSVPKWLSSCANSARTPSGPTTRCSHGSTATMGAPSL